MMHETLDLALLAIQQELKDPVKNKTGQVGQKKYKYAGLDEVMDGARLVANKHGVYVSQPVVIEQGLVCLETRLTHGKSGEWKSSFFPLEWTGSSQARGSELTYARRYSLEAILGMVASEDDDGAAATEAHKPASEAPPNKEAPAPKATSKNIDSLRKAWFGKFDKAYPTPKQKDGLTPQEAEAAAQKNYDIQAMFFKNRFGVTSLKEIPDDRAGKFEAWLRTHNVEELRSMIDSTLANGSL